MSKNKIFSVVEFDDGLQLVPSTWLINDSKTCYFPKYVSIKRIETAVKEQEPPTGNWRTYPVKRIFASSDSYKRGIKKLKKAEYESDNFTATEREVSELSDSCDDTVKNNFPTFPSTSSSIRSSVLDTAVHVVTPSNITEGVTRYTEDLSDILKQLQIIKLRLERIEEVQYEVLRKFDTPAHLNFESEAIELPHLPLENLAFLHDLEKNLLNLDFKANFQIHINRIGGSSVSDIVRRLMSHLLSNSLAMEFSYLGMRKKRSFSNLLLHGVIFDAVCFHMPQVTKAEMAKSISNWLRHAKERVEKHNKMVECVNNYDF